MEPRWTAWIETARAAWPRLRVRDQVFVEFLESRGLEPGTTPAPTAARLADLYLACACQQGVSGALAAFEGYTQRDVEAAVAGSKLGSAGKEDVAGLVRQKLFVASAGARAKIEEYSGRGSLRGWVRAIAARTAIDQSRRHHGEVALDDELSRALPSPELDPELAHFKRRYAKDFKAAFQEATASLGAREQLLLRQYYLDGLDTNALAKLYRVHVVTAVRWMGKLRAELARRTQRVLRDRLQIESSEFRSIARLVQSQVDVSLRRVLGAAPSRSTGGGEDAP